MGDVRLAVTLDDAEPRPALHDLACAARDAGHRRDLTNESILALASGIPHPGNGVTAQLWEALATVASQDLGVARALEPHLDALAILHEAGPGKSPEGAWPVDATWGVYAAEGPGVRLAARRHDGGWTLTGRKPWCSLAGTLTHALVTAWVGEHHRGLFAIDLRHPGVSGVDLPWVATGLVEVPSGPIDVETVPATAVGEPGWYLHRAGFAWGGMGVAAVWYGGAVGLLRRMIEQASERDLDQIGLAHVGAVSARLQAARALLARAAVLVDAGAAQGSAGEQLAAEVRDVVAHAAEEALARAAHALGPGPLVAEPAHARRMADLHLYLRQHHGERDQARLGSMVLRSGTW